MLPIPWREPDTVPLLNATPFHAFPLTWQLQPPQDAMIMVVKATFDLVQGQPATIADEHILPTGEEPFEDAESPECLRYPGDMALFKPKADVFLVGNAYPPATGFAVTLVRFAVGSTVEAALAVVGDRMWKDGVPTSPVRFDRMELRPDRAFGGPKLDANPVGRGHGAEDGTLLPNIEWHDSVTKQRGDVAAPALTTPIPVTWKSRMRHAGTYDAGWVDRAPNFPPDFDWRFFNAAPEKFQVPYLRGDEPYWIKGVDPDGALLEGRLPGIVPRVFALPAAQPDAFRELPMNLDTVWFDTEARKLVLVWRGAIACADQVGSDLAAFLVRADPVGQPASQQVVHECYVEEYDKKYVLDLDDEEEEGEEEAPELRSDANLRPPIGVTPEMARALGLPPSAASVHLEDDHVEPPPPPPPPTAALTSAEVDSLLASGEPIEDADLSRCDLSNRDLHGRTFVSCDLTGAKLMGCGFKGAVLTGSVLAEIEAEGVDFSNADLRGTDFAGAKLSRAIFTDADLTEANLSNAVCAGALFEGAKLNDLLAMETDFTGCRFDGAEAHGGDLTGARLEGASMAGIKAEDLRLYEVQATALILDDSELTRLRADNACFLGASFQRVEASDSSIRQADLTQADFRKATLDESVFEDSNLERALFSQVEATECRWSRVHAKGASFLKANLMSGFFESANFEGADLRGANLYECDTHRAIFLGADLTHAILGNSGLG